MSNSRIYLRGINLTDLVEKFFNSKFQDVTEEIPFSKENLTETSEIINIQKYSEKTTYEINFGSGVNFACVGYRVSDKEGHYSRYDPNGEYRCMNCIRKITGNPWGIPIKREKRDNKYIYSTVDIFCSPQCTFRILNDRIYNSIYSQSLSYFSEMYEVWTESQFSDLKPASDPRMLKILNGPLNWENYHRMHKSFSEKPSNIYMFPVIEYLEQDF